MPKHYALRIVPTATNDRFTGTARIDIEVAKAVASIELNALELEIQKAQLDATPLTAKLDPQRETVVLAPASGTIAPGRHQLDIEYSGRIQRHPFGLHQTAYRERDGQRLLDKTMLATHMEPVHARRVFPGWDEPVFRATFDISLVIDEHLTAVSNMPMLRETRLAGGKKEVAFARSVSMPTFLVAFFVGELDYLEDNVDGIALRVYTTRGKTAQARFAMTATKEILHYYNDYFGIRYALPKLDQLAVPPGLFGAQENWGAIYYNEGRLLYDESDPSLRQQQRIYGLIAHEVAHQWLGNLVTMAWWDNLWLKEGFASWMATKTVERFHPQWQARLRVALYRQVAMSDDARRITHAIQTPVTDEARAMDVFDAITYGKGESFIAMLEGYLGEDAFREGIRRYMRAHQFSNTTTADLWHHLAEASGRDVAAFAAPWTEQPGFPLVKVEQRCTGGGAEVTLSQERFTLNDPRARRLTWKVPVTLADAAGTRHALLLDREPQRLRLKTCGAVHANVGDTGYYRVHYDPRSLELLARELPRLAPSDRLRLLLDSFALMQAGRLDVARYLALFDGLQEESDPRVWEHVTDAMRFLRGLIDAPDDQAVFDAATVRLLRKPFARVGWDARSGEGADDALMRRLLIDELGRAGDADILREARARFAARTSKPVDASLRPAVLNVVAHRADDATFDALRQWLRTATDADLKNDLRTAMRHVGEPERLRRWLDTLLATNELSPGDAAYDITRSATDSGHGELVWRFVVANLPGILAKASPRGRTFILPEAAWPSSDAARADELLALTKQHLQPGAYYIADKTADWIRLRAEVKSREEERAMRWARGILGT